MHKHISLSQKICSKRNFLDSFKLKEFEDDNIKFDEITESSPEGWKTLWEK